MAIVQPSKRPWSQSLPLHGPPMQPAPGPRVGTGGSSLAVQVHLHVRVGNSWSVLLGIPSTEVHTESTVMHTEHASGPLALWASAQCGSGMHVVPARFTDAVECPHAVRRDRPGPAVGGWCCRSAGRARQVDVTHTVAIEAPAAGQQQHAAVPVRGAPLRERRRGEHARMHPLFRAPGRVHW